MSSQQKIKRIEEILEEGNPEEVRALFHFSVDEDVDMIMHKYRLWCRYFLAKYFYDKARDKIIEDAPFHYEIDKRLIEAYKGEEKGGIKSFTNIAARGLGKTTRTKLFVAFFILNDEDHYRRYIKVLTSDVDNGKQFVTDVYNILVMPRIKDVYPNMFKKSEYKKEERMDSFTTSTGVKMVADTVGTNQRGALQEEARPDFEIMDDFEVRLSVSSATLTNAIWLNMEEARNALSPNGSVVYNCNYFSERGNVHKLVQRASDRNVVLIVPIIKDGIPAWEDMHTVEKIQNIREDAEDFEGEYLCEPSAGFDVYFDRTILKEMLAKAKQPYRTISDFKMFYQYDPSHLYAMGHDVSGGVGLDSSTTVVIDFSTVPNRVVATYKTNTIKPDAFGYEIKTHGDRYGGALSSPEQNNHGHATIAILKQEYDNIYTVQQKDTRELLGKHNRVKSVEYGWKTNKATKPKMFAELRKAVHDGLLDLTDADLIREAISYSRDDLMEGELDPRLTTRHFDLLTACAIAYQMRTHATFGAETFEQKQQREEDEEMDATSLDFYDKFNVI
jgi:hypothetical protein